MTSKTNTSDLPGSNFPRLKPQTAKVLEHLERAGSITGVEAEAVHRIRHLPARIFELRQAGFTVSSHPRTDVTGQRYVHYRLEAV